MLDTKLIIVDGMSGSGKTTTATLIGDELKRLGIDCRVFRETDNGNPLFIDTPSLPSFTKEEEDRFIAHVKTIYSEFVHNHLNKQEIVIIESVIFQGIVSITPFKGIDQDKLLNLTQFIQETISVKG